MRSVVLITVSLFAAHCVLSCYSAEALTFVDKILDGALQIVRNTTAARRGRAFRIPGNISISELVLDEVTLSNMLNMYRTGDSSIGWVVDGLNVRTALEVRNVSMAAKYTLTQWPVSTAGDIHSYLDYIRISADLLLSSTNFQRIRFNSFNVTDLGSLEVIKLTGAYDFVRSIVNTVLNTSVMKEFLMDRIQKLGFEAFADGFH